ncbi:hypothetical protein Rsub_09907 [Raphidocelis subcapitata]|uniref:DUF1214 domain-containing protein n=1 Tax=Raphidocelis subcapitata TaxID=307507 RepID=A0A2V0PD69_9CHLO|nr:hypothetical protein Rsub_09907 [Raphidocelis subcapitata]|eukprot:GBF96902.1 hypothetical protein Rsub_09907 [Raphidocelis subcapitata]
MHGPARPTSCAPRQLRAPAAARPGSCAPRPLGPTHTTSDRDPLKFAPDGSLMLYLQPDSPGAEKEPNRLPGPASGGVAMTMRVSAPKPQVRDGRWAPPAVRKAA